MARIAGVDLPNDKRVVIGLTYLFGIGNSTARKIMQLTGVNPDTRIKNLTEEETARLRQVIESQFKVEARAGARSRCPSSGSWTSAPTGPAYRKNLPARGQRTRTSAHPRGPKTAGAMRKVTAVKRPAPKPAG